MAVSETIGLDGGMQMKAQRELIASGRHRIASCRHEQVFTVNLLSILCQDQHPLMDDIEKIGITVMRCANNRAVRLLLALDLDDAWAAHHGDRLEHVPDRPGLDERAR